MRTPNWQSIISIQLVEGGQIAEEGSEEGRKEETSVPARK